ncbi:MAG: hypothetical protein PWP51_2987 [Clostridiales bacterium]|jgi:hypothetical protein|nr:hypothetical protein [Clostridiales bacterium]MDN5300434.1 hypothetical protein [Clostridiales bacterium]
MDTMKQQLHDEIAAIIRQCGAYVSDQQITVDGQMMNGLGMWPVHRDLMHTAEEIACFKGKIVVFGGFNTGKSTLINALTGEMVLPVKVLSHHGCRQIATASRLPKQVEITYENGDRVSMMSDTEAYKQQFLMRPLPDSNVENDRDREMTVVHYGCSGDFCKDGIEIHESAPIGTSRHEIEAATLIASAHAIVFVISGPQLFSQEERHFLKMRLMGQRKNNVFFIINKIDQVGDYLDDIKQAVNFHLEPFFTNEKGDVDRTLFEQRVFFLDSRTAMLERVAGKTTQPFAAFVESLKAWIHDSSRMQLMVSSACYHLQNAIEAVREQMETEQAALSMPMEILMQKAQLSEESLQRAEREAKQVKRSFTLAERVIQTKIYDDLWRYINELERAWESDAEALNIQMGVGDMLKLAVTTSIPKSAQRSWNPLVKPFRHT